MSDPTKSQPASEPGDRTDPEPRLEPELIKDLDLSSEDDQAVVGGGPTHGPDQAS